MTTLEIDRLAMSGETAKVLAKHLLSLVLPLTTLSFVLTGFHPWYLAWLWMIPVVGSVMADNHSPPERRQPLATMAPWPFDVLLYGLAALQVINIALLVKMMSQTPLFSLDVAVAVILVGANSGYSGIVVAHELIHRGGKANTLFARVLMGLVMYEHFCTEHVRGHHARVGTPEDPATARFGERFWSFLKRTIPGQFRSAWRLECKRLGDVSMRIRDRRMRHHRVLQGLVAEWLVAALILGMAGPVAFIVFLGQAMIAILELEAVNYFEHWGLVRVGKRVRTIDSWDTESGFTMYTLIGLSRHADHHAYAARPYPQLRLREESAKLPGGYFGMVMMGVFQNRKFQRLMTEELRKRQLGPFAPVPVPAA